MYIEFYLTDNHQIFRADAQVTIVTCFRYKQFSHFDGQTFSYMNELCTSFHAPFSLAFNVIEVRGGRFSGMPMKIGSQKIFFSDIRSFKSQENFFLESSGANNSFSENLCVDLKSHVIKNPLGDSSVHLILNIGHKIAI